MRSAATGVLVAALGALLLLAAPAAAQGQQYCDGRGGLQSAYCDHSDPSCSGSCRRCSAAQVLGAMGAAPDDPTVQWRGCWAPVILARGTPANQAAIAAAGGAERVTAAMARLPDDREVQFRGCYALNSLAQNSPANQAAIAAAGGVERVTAAMVRFPDVSWVQFSCQAAVDALPAAEARCTCHAWTSDDCISCSPAQVVVALDAAPDDRTCSTSAATRWC